MKLHHDNPKRYPDSQLVRRTRIPLPNSWIIENLIGNSILMVWFLRKTIQLQMDLKTTNKLQDSNPNLLNGHYRDDRHDNPKRYTTLTSRNYDLTSLQIHQTTNIITFIFYFSRIIFIKHSISGIRGGGAPHKVVLIMQSGTTNRFNS